MSNDITALRAHLFDTLSSLKDKENPMDIERAKAVSDVAQVIINSAKVEVEHMKIAGGSGSGFIVPASLRRFASIFCRQNSAFCFGHEACSGQPCQKHPSTKTAILSPGKATSATRRGFFRTS